MGSVDAVVESRDGYIPAWLNAFEVKSGQNPTHYGVAVSNNGIGQWAHVQQLVQSPQATGLICGRDDGQPLIPGNPARFKLKSNSLLTLVSR